MKDNFVNKKVTLKIISQQPDNSKIIAQQPDNSKIIFQQPDKLMPTKKLSLKLVRYDKSLEINKSVKPIFIGNIAKITINMKKDPIIEMLRTDCKIKELIELYKDSPSFEVVKKGNGKYQCFIKITIGEEKIVLIPINNDDKFITCFGFTDEEQYNIIKNNNFHIEPGGHIRGTRSWTLYQIVHGKKADKGG